MLLFDLLHDFELSGHFSVYKVQRMEYQWITSDC